MVYCPEKKSDKKIKDKSSNKKCHFTGKNFYCGKVDHRINVFPNKKAAEKTYVALDIDRKNENEKVELALSSTS